MATDYERLHRLEMARLEQRIKQLYEQVIQEASQLGISIDTLTDDLFSFDNFPATHDRIDKLMSDLQSRMKTAIVEGINSQWTLANNKNNELCYQVFGDNLNRLTLDQQQRYFRNNENARDAFIARRDSATGLNLSDRVWHYTDLYRHEIEMSLDVGIRAGLSAGAMAREMQQYLQNPDKLFRRVRDQHGDLVLSKAAKAYHPGRGVYRSSYMNARRLAVTETNMAYRTADHLRVQQLDFVVGIEIHLSGNHTCKGVKGIFVDICDELQGKYPKDFKFTGWHPHCRCYTTTILKTPKEFTADEERIKNGEPPNEESENSVTDMPANFKQWLDDNQGRIARSATLPYFLADNGHKKRGDEGNQKARS